MTIAGVRVVYSTTKNATNKLIGRTRGVRCEMVLNSPPTQVLPHVGSCHVSQCTMDREKWMDPSTRVTATIDAFTKTLHDAGDISLVQDMNVCDLDVTLAGLCKDIQTARGAVFEGNCQGVGSCLHELFYYQPFMLSLSNNQFVRQTVEEFYRHIHPNSCIVWRTSVNPPKKCPSGGGAKISSSKVIFRQDN